MATPPCPKRQKRAVEDDLICPITLDLPVDPVTAEDGLVYERSAIEEYFQGKNGRTVPSPVTKEKIGKKLLRAVKHKNTIENLVESGVIKGDLATTWQDKINQKQKMQELLTMAEAGDGKAMGYLAQDYLFGLHGFPRDRKLGISWAKQGHEKNDVRSTYVMAYCSSFGFGRPKNEAEGVFYLTLAAERGSSRAALQLGIFFAKGQCGLSKTKKEAIAWLERAFKEDGRVEKMSEKNKAEAQSLLEQLTTSEP